MNESSDHETDDDDKYHFKIITMQVHAFRTLIEALNAILVECNFEFLPEDAEEDNVGMLKILAINASIGLLVNLRLFAKNFDLFQCSEKQIIGLNISNLYKIIKATTNSDVLKIYRLKTDENKIRVSISNEERCQQFEYQTSIQYIDQDVLDISKVTFDAVIVMSANDFQKILKDLSGLDSKYIDIELMNKTLKISANGQIGSGCAIINEKSTRNSVVNHNIAISRNDDSNESIKGRFELKNLLLFTKATSLSNSIEIYLKQNFPLLIKYEIAILGFLNLCLSPILEEHNEDISSS